LSRCFCILFGDLQFGNSCKEEELSLLLSLNSDFPLKLNMIFVSYDFALPLTFEKKNWAAANLGQLTSKPDWTENSFASFLATFLCMPTSTRYLDITYVFKLFFSESQTRVVKCTELNCCSVCCCSELFTLSTFISKRNNQKLVHATLHILTEQGMPGFTAISRLKYFCGRAFFVWIRIAVRTGSTLVPMFTAILRLKRCYSNLMTQNVTAIWSLFILDNSIP
jgi:hypothetical protein